MVCAPDHRQTNGAIVSCRHLGRYVRLAARRRSRHELPAVPRKQTTFMLPAGGFGPGAPGPPGYLGMSLKLQEFVTFCRDAVMITLVRVVRQPQIGVPAWAPERPFLTITLGRRKGQCSNSLCADFGANSKGKI